MPDPRHDPRHDPRDHPEYFYERTMWGTVAGGIDLPDPYPHVRCTFTRYPDGLAVLVRCDRCGGRREGMIRYPEVPDSALPLVMAAVADPTNADKFAASQRALMAHDAAGVAGIERQMLVSVKDVIDLWVPTHRACREVPRVYELPPLLERIVRGRVDRARKRIRRGQQAEATIELVCTEGMGLLVPMAGIPASTDAASSRAKSNALAERIHGLKVRALEHGLTPLAGLAIAEAWETRVDVTDIEAALPPHTLADNPDRLARELAKRDASALYPSTRGDRVEALNVVVVTRDPVDGFGRAGHARITRRGGVPDEGPGDIAPFAWSPLTADSRLVDGLLAFPE